MALCFASLRAETTPDGIADNVTLSKNGAFMLIEMDIDLTQVEVTSNEALLLTPQLVKEDQTKDLPAIGIYGRKRYFYYNRNRLLPSEASGEITIKASQKPDTQHYRTLVDYEPWMDGAQLQLRTETYGCCQEVLADGSMVLASYNEPKFVPQYVYVQPEAEVVKTRSLSGSAFIDFPVSRTEIKPDYRNNRVELAKIRATIDSVRNDADIRITALSIKGYASPEGSYANNKRLASGRTQSLKEYVAGLYHFNDTLISTSYEAEDWAGLRKYVEQSSLPHRQEILDLIDSDREPDNKEYRIKKEYPEDYAVLLRDCYPVLRHSDYRVEYIIRSFSSADEIRPLIQSQPQKLSLQEFYLASQGMEPGSEEFNKVFETAVRIYPDDETANLNAANTAMAEGDLNAASQYLDKAGNSPQAIYARGIYAILTENYAEAQRLLQDAQNAGITKATEALEYAKYKNEQ